MMESMNKSGPEGNRVNKSVEKEGHLGGSVC